VYAIQIKNLTKIYKNGHEALRGINLYIKKGQFLGLLGKNGAGKTTLIEILSSLSFKTSGKVLVINRDLDCDREIIKASIGIVPQEFNLAIFEKAIDILITQAGYFGISYHTAKYRATRLLSELGLWDKRDQTASTFSGGMKRRLMIARALIHEPEIIFLDEPTAGVDAEVRVRIWQIMRRLNEEGKTIILTTHYFEEVEKLCDSLAIISQGKIVANDLLANLFSRYTRKKYHIKTKKNVCLNIISPKIVKISDCMYEINIANDESLTDYIKTFINQGIEITEVLHRSNSLEDLFLNFS